MSFCADPVQDSAELRRIIGLPRRSFTAGQLSALADQLTELLRTPNGTQRLRPIQALALYEIGTTRGLAGMMQVGSGKTLVTLLAGRLLGARNPLLLLPASLIDKTLDERDKYSRDWRIIPCRTLSYQMLSQASHENWLELFEPDAVIGDEAQHLKNPRAAVTRRVTRHLKKHPGIPVVLVTGTFLGEGIGDCGHLLQWCTPRACPIPTTYTDRQEWADAIDQKATAFQRRDPGALLRLCTPEDLEHDRLTAVRRGFARRLTSTPGVVAFGEDDVCTPDGEPIGIHVRAIEYEQDPIVEEHFETLRREWETPCGWSFSMATEVWARARCLALGFHLVWDPLPPGGVKGEWMLARRAWKKIVRDTIAGSQHLDSEKQVIAWAKTAPKGARGSAATVAWTRWENIAPSFTPTARAVWHDDGATEVCQRWAQGGAGVIWTGHTPFAERLSKRLGLRYFGPGGIDATGMRIEDADPRSVVIASIEANSKGRNIQFWSRCLVTAPPMSSDKWEQLIGRFHRAKQNARRVDIDVLVGCREHADGWARSLSGAQMTVDTTGASQKLLIATYEGFPSASDLEEREAREEFKWTRVVARKEFSFTDVFGLPTDE